jgi:hypothetical protein
MGGAEMSGKIIKTSPEELSRVVGEAVAMQFRNVGIIAHDDEAMAERRRDFDFLHDLRKSTESAKSRIGVVLLMLATGGIVSMIVSGIKLWAKQP